MHEKAASRMPELALQTIILHIDALRPAGDGSGNTNIELGSVRSKVNTCVTARNGTLTSSFAVTRPHAGFSFIERYGRVGSVPQRVQAIFHQGFVSVNQRWSIQFQR